MSISPSRGAGGGSNAAAARLSTPWVFWRDRWDVRDGETVQTLTDLGETDTTRSFWALYKNNAIDDLPDNSSLHVFKHHVKPEWEDASNINGGHFRFMAIPSAVHGRPEEKFWYSIISGSIGEHFTLSSAINGVGFTNKGTRRVVSVWLNTADPAAIRTLQRELSQFSQDRFTCKFVAHRTLPRANFDRQQSCEHRRTKSMPEKYLHLEFDDGAAASSTAVDEPSPNANSQTLSPGAGGAHHPPASPQAVDAAEDDREVERIRNVVEHVRSKSDGYRTEMVPALNLLHTRGSTPPPTNQQQPIGIGAMAEDLRESASGNSGVYPVGLKAPSPMKAWADQWSPSLMGAQALKQSNPSPFSQEAIKNSEQQQQQMMMLQQQQQQMFLQQQQQQQQHRRDGGASTPPAQPNMMMGLYPTSSATGGGGGGYDQQQFHAMSQLQQQHQQAALLYAQQVQLMQQQQQQQQGGAGGMPVQQFGASQQFYRTPDRTAFGQQKTDHAGRGGGVKGAGAGRSGGNSGRGSGEKPPRLSTPPPAQQQQQQTVAAPSQQQLAQQQQTKSDAAPFVWNGWRYPAGLNRKERRRIMFNPDVDPKEIEGAVFVGADVPNGNIKEE